ncbi:uncharacterized protein LACBIDRAFT_331915 [Laccaria bicolor S238N-H82]|uniref:Predicted protein n=1 Tax=Laccaria bicolor (strain S238N-H82 / ATCC MYA-4686) TaxID=486041 RepID=B0DR15_LACBS|nr:uncharacterized protein LACBIDRAFT_331915 [Laccaria bicolor S238N-H82]EDR02984.1 predicted protein [Laccaria bicolor S238N-H82]|eukprot:XP_001886407.1 predicted protein [Laccaria bicolor S238N-H82]
MSPRSKNQGLQSISVNTTDFVVSHLSFSNASVFDALWPSVASEFLIKMPCLGSSSHYGDTSVFDAYTGTAIHDFLNGLMQFFSLCWVFTLEPLRALLGLKGKGKANAVVEVNVTATTTSDTTTWLNTLDKAHHENGPDEHSQDDAPDGRTPTQCLFTRLFWDSDDNVEDYTAPLSPMPIAGPTKKTKLDS